MNIKIKERIYQLLNSDAISYLETSERLILKNFLEKDIISQGDVTDLDRILKKYRKFIKN